MEFFDASGGSAGDERSTKARDALLRMQADDADVRLQRLLDDVDEMLAESQARDVEQGLDPDIATLLHRITGAEDAPLEFRSLHRRVSEGRLTWLDFWLRPEEEVGGMTLIRAAMKAQAAVLEDLVAATEAEERQESERRAGGQRGSGAEWRRDDRPGL